MTMNSKRILIIDDDVEFAGTVQAVLESEGYWVDTAPDGDRGLTSARNAEPDLIILDVMMNHLTEGFEVCRRIRASDVLEDVPILLVTGISREMNLPFSFEQHPSFLPVTNVIEKPVEPKALLNAVNKALKTTPTPTTREDSMAKRALIIDDNADFAASMGELLTANGYKVETAGGGAAGLDRAVSNPPDLMLIDVMMEDCGAGLDLVKKLKQNPATKGIPVFVVTGIRKPEFLLQSFAPEEQFPNVKKVFEKPVEPAALINALETVA